jgi:WD40 repeat protein
MDAHAHCVAITPDGRRLLTIDELSNIHVWDTEKRQRIRTARWHFGAPLDLAVTTDGHRFAAGVNELLVYNLTTLQPEFSVPLEHTRDLSMSPDGRLLAQSDSLGRVHIVDLASQGVLHEFQIGPHHGFINQVEFASDSRHLFTANGNGSIYILRLSAPEQPSLK